MSKISKELIESYRKIVLPFVSSQLYRANFEGQGAIDRAEFEQDCNEILDLAISALNPTGDCISREALKDIAYINKGNFNTVEGIREWIDNAQAVEYTFEEAFQKTVCDNKSYCPSRQKGDCENCDYRKFSETCVDAVVEVMNEYGITSAEELMQKLKGGAK